MSTEVNVWVVYANWMCSRQWVLDSKISHQTKPEPIYKYRCYHAQIYMHAQPSVSPTYTSHVTLSYLGSWVGACAHVCVHAIAKAWSPTVQHYVSGGHQTGGARASQGKGRAGSPYYSHASWNPHVCYRRTSVYRNTPNREVVGHHFALIWTLCTMFTLCKWSWYVIQYACHYYWIQIVCLITTCVRS